MPLLTIIAFIIGTVALIIAIDCNSKVTRLKKENIELRNFVNFLYSRVDSKGVPNNQPVQPFVAQPIQNKSINIPPSMQVGQGAPMRQGMPINPSPVVPTIKQKKEKSNIENIFGKNVIGIAATILIFIGVIAFGTLIFTRFTDIVKVISMFVASFLTAGIGLYLTKKNKTSFSEILTGCGMGMIYISLFISHLYFGIINDIATYIFVFLWVGAVSFISKKLSLKSLSYVAFVGCIISSIFALIYGFATQKFAEITIYHIITFILLIFSNKENKLLFKLSSWFSILMNTILGGVIYSFVHSRQIPLFASQYDIILLVLSLILSVYNIIIYAYSSKETLCDNLFDSIISNIINCINAIFTFCLPISFVLDICLRNVSSSYNCLSFIFVPIVFVFVLLSQMLYRFCVKENNKRVCSFVFSEIFLSLIMLFSPFIIQNGEFATLLLFPILNLFLYNKYKCKNDKSSDVFYWAGFGILVFDCFTSMFMLSNFEIIGIFYSAVLIGLMSLYFKSKYNSVLVFPFAQSILFNIHFLITGLRFTGFLNISANYILIFIVLCNIAYSIYAAMVNKTENKASNVLMEIENSLMVLILSVYVSLSTTAPTVSSFILSSLLLPFALIRIKSVIKNKNAFLIIWYGIKFTYLTYSTVATFTSLVEQRFVFSLFFMIIALICIVFGFMKELKPLRIYGLVLIMSSVFKMVIFDVSNQDSLVRVGALIAGGIICFAISAIYSRVEKQKKIIELKNKSNNA